MMPPATARLRFREMTEADLDVMAGLLGDPEVMRFYGRPKTREEALDWIRWNRRNYERHGYGLWIIETHEGIFVGDCGLTWQTIDGKQYLEVGYHVVPSLQGKGYATEAASACAGLAIEEIGETLVIGIINPANRASRRVAEKLGMVVDRETEAQGSPVVIYALCGATRR